MLPSPRSVRVLLIGCLLLSAMGGEPAPSVRVLRFADGIPFQMGDVISHRIVHPAMGARHTTLNYSVSKPGAEFAQHVHEASDDTILVLQGEVNLRQGDSLRLLRAGEAAFVPAGQIHGTVTAGTGETIMISFQNPPDAALYTGARDPKRAAAAAPQGLITPGAVKVVRFDDKDGFFTSPSMGSQHAAAAHRRLGPTQALRLRVAADAEELLFVWEGSIRIKHAAGISEAQAKDTLFIAGPADVTVAAAPHSQARLIHVQAPPFR